LFATTYNLCDRDGDSEKKRKRSYEAVRRKGDTKPTPQKNTSASEEKTKRITCQKITPGENIFIEKEKRKTSSRNFRF